MHGVVIMTLSSHNHQRPLPHNEEEAAFISDFNDREMADQVNSLMAVLGQHNIKFYPILVDLTQSVSAAIFMGQLFYHTRKLLAKQQGNSGVCQPQAQWEEETYLSRRYLATAVDLLQELGFVEVRRKKNFRAPVYLLKLEQLAQALAKQAEADFTPAYHVTTGDILIQLLGKPKVFNHALARIAGDSITAGLILSYLIGVVKMWSSRGNPPTWIENPIELIENELRLNRNQQEHARRKLVALKLIHESTTRSTPPVLRMRLNLGAVAARALQLGVKGCGLWITPKVIHNDIVEIVAKNKQKEAICSKNDATDAHILKSVIEILGNDVHILKSAIEIQANDLHILKRAIEIGVNHPHILKSANHILKSAIEIPQTPVDNFNLNGAFQDIHYINTDLKTTTTANGKFEAADLPTASVVVVSDSFDEKHQNQNQKPVQNLVQNQTSLLPADLGQGASSATPKSLDLILPAGLIPSVANALKSLLSPIELSLAQDFLDELAWNLKRRQISNPIGYVRTMMTRYENGEFTKENAFQVQAERQARAEAKIREAEDQKLAMEEAQRRSDPTYLAELKAARERTVARYRRGGQS
jgi:hypothetical protein